MKRTPIQIKNASLATNWIPTQGSDRRGPLRLQGSRTRGACCAMACPTTVHSTKATPTNKVKRAQYVGVRNGVHSSRTPNRQPEVSLDT